MLNCLINIHCSSYLLVTVGNSSLLLPHMRYTPIIWCYWFENQTFCHILTTFRRMNAIVGQFEEEKKTRQKWVWIRVYSTTNHYSVSLLKQKLFQTIELFMVLNTYSCNRTECTCINVRVPQMLDKITKTATTYRPSSGELNRSSR